MKIKANKVEGKTTKAGSKQGRTYEILKESTVKGFLGQLPTQARKCLFGT